MPSIRAPLLRAGLQPSSRLLLLPPRTHQPLPFLLQTRQESQVSRNEKMYEPNDGGQSKAKEGHKGGSGRYQLDGTSTMGTQRALVYAGGLVVILAGIYFVGLGRPDEVVPKDVRQDPLTVKRSERQRVGGPERSEK